MDQWQWIRCSLIKKFRTPPCEPQLLVWILTFGTHPPAVCFLTITIIKVLCADLFWWSQQRGKGFLGGCSHNSITVLIGQCYKPGLAKFHQNILQNREIRSYFAKYLHFDMGEDANDMIKIFVAIWIDIDNFDDKYFQINRFQRNNGS